MKFETKTIHAGVHPDKLTGAVMTPIYQTSTYAQDAIGDHKGYEYARGNNLTRDVLQNNLAALENGLGAVCFASGLAAMDAIVKLYSSGDEILGSNDLYGGSYRLLRKIYSNFGIESHFLDLHNPEVLLSAITEKTKLIWIETPSNPLLKILDIKRICEIAHSKGIKVCVDNTFASPYLQQPLELGADMVMHSATKYLGGHSDVIHGCIICKHQEDLDQLKFIANASGGVPGPFDCFLILRGIKTLHIRVDRACDNAEKIAAFLLKHPKVGKVFYPGFPDHPGHALAAKQMRRFGAIVSFELASDNMDEVHTVLKNTEVFTLAESLGGVESLMTHPSSMTHGAIPREERLKAGLKDGLIRLSVGIEHSDDLIQDLEKALATA
jgi:cystathionine beta-lyase/cystathionine gamma-synthase